MITKTIASSRGAAVMLSLAGAAALWAASMAPAYAETLFNVTNLVSDGTVPAKVVDLNLINPWGIAMSPTSPFWISDNGTGLATLYSVSANNSSVNKIGLTVTIPPAFGSPPSAPTGQVFNGGAGFVIGGPAGSPARFLFELRGRGDYGMERGDERGNRREPLGDELCLQGSCDRRHELLSVRL